MPPTPWTPGNYPPARRSDHIDVYQSAQWGEVHITDPYRWLEEYSDETENWITSDLSKNMDKGKLEDAFRSSMDYTKFSAPTLLDDGHWYWFCNSGLQAQAVLSRSKEAALPDFSKEDDVVGDVFFDPNLLSTDASGSAALSIYRFSRCGKYFVYGVSFLGSDFSTLYVRSTTSPLSRARRDSGVKDERFPDEIKNVKFSTLAWTKVSKGFFYQRFPARDNDDPKAKIEMSRDRNAMLYYHIVGTPQCDDLLTFGTETSEDGKYLYLLVQKSAEKKMLLWVAELDQNGFQPGIPWRKVINEFQADYTVITNEGSLLYVKTDFDAPQYKVVTIDLSTEPPKICDFISEDNDAKLFQINCANKEYFVVIYKRNVKDEIYLYSKKGDRLARLAPDFVGAATIINREKHSHFFITMTGFNTPGTIGRYDFTAPEAQRWSIYRSTRVNGLNPDDFESLQVWYDSKDGTKVPMFIVRHKSTKFDGTAPAIQYGYGGFTISVDPFFSATILKFLQIYGAILAVPNIRGGGEFGEAWHQSGIREKKVNGLDDFIAATEHLVTNKYAGAGKVAINGASNGGLLIGACVNRAPEGTFGAAVAEVGTMNLLRSLGNAWATEYGDSDNPVDFDFMYPLSPLHNLPKHKVLPPTLLMTADHDDRVVPMHAFKLASTLQHTLPLNPHPLLIRIDKRTGHGAGKPTETRIKDPADKWGFVAQSMGLLWRESD
ncbi:prolyl oligopeptidase [Russula dissimulans]|nr:prolyl oligopeptidase [Russula dissimulans]